MEILETMIGKTQFKVEVFDMDTSSSNGRVTTTYDYHLTNYKVRRKIMTSQDYNYTSLDFHVLIVDKWFKNS